MEESINDMNYGMMMNLLDRYEKLLDKLDAHKMR